jgi:RNA polymerase sigma-70 factor (ECF subfamily)
VNQIIDPLPEKKVALIISREIESTSYEDIAKMTDCLIGTVRCRILGAREPIVEKPQPLLDIV